LKLWTKFCFLHALLHQAFWGDSACQTHVKLLSGRADKHLAHCFHGVPMRGWFLLLALWHRPGVGQGPESVQMHSSPHESDTSSLTNTEFFNNNCHTETTSKSTFAFMTRTCWLMNCSKCQGPIRLALAVSWDIASSAISSCHVVKASCLFHFLARHLRFTKQIRVVY
jgi:hypothetical protein